MVTRGHKTSICWNVVSPQQLCTRQRGGGFSVELALLLSQDFSHLSPKNHLWSILVSSLFSVCHSHFSLSVLVIFTISFYLSDKYFIFFLWQRIFLIPVSKVFLSLCTVNLFTQRCWFLSSESSTVEGGKKTYFVFSTSSYSIPFLSSAEVLLSPSTLSYEGKALTFICTG